MSVYSKLQRVKVELQKIPMKKSGHNKFAGYQYFELGDFLPHVNQLFDSIGLCSIVSFTPEIASLRVVDLDDSTEVTFTSPMADAPMKGTLPIQNMGAVQTYSRRYLYMMALDIVEHDAIDAVTQDNKSKVTPNAGAGDDLSNDQKNRLADIATAIKDSFEVDDDIALMTFYSEVTDQAEKLYLWSLLASQVRTKIKKLGQEQK